MHARAAMKACAQCHGKLGLGVRARNVWNGRWWIRHRFCSVRCETGYQLERHDATKRCAERQGYCDRPSHAVAALIIQHGDRIWLQDWA
jgi:hypothetical protein